MSSPADTVFDLAQYGNEIKMATPRSKVCLLRALTRKLIDSGTISSTLRKDYELLVRENICYLQAMKDETEVAAEVASGKHLHVAILGYKSEQVGCWDPDNVKTGLPGSEECVVYAAEELSRRGHLVTIYMNPPSNSLWRSPFSNPRWVPLELWVSPHNKYTYDLALLWRRLDQEVARERASRVFFWPHDSPSFSAIHTKAPPFDGLCFLSNHHRQQYLRSWPAMEKLPYVICGNGILLQHFPTPANASNVHSVGYFSNYSRGLETLLKIWPRVRQEFPAAVLNICYGRETWGTLSAQAMADLVDKITSDPSIKEWGKVGHQQLADIMSTTSVWAYPCNTLAETFCITASKCQAAGCIPVTTRLGALAETVAPCALTVARAETPEEIATYQNLLLTTLRGATLERKERQPYIDFAAGFTWKHCVDKWLQLYFNLA